MRVEIEFALILGAYGLLCGFVLGLMVCGWVRNRVIARAYHRGFDHGRVQGISEAARTVVPARAAHLRKIKGGR